MAFLYGDEAEFHLNPGLSRCWSGRGKRVIVPSAGQNRRVPVFGALDAMTGEVSAMITAKKRSGEFLDFLRWLLPATWTENCYPLLNHACFPYTATRKRRI